MKWFVGITTCERPAELKALLKQLQYSGVGPHVHIIDDTGGEALRVSGGWWTIVQHAERYGKARFWETYNELMKAFLETDADYFVSLPDDCEIARTFFLWLEPLLERAPVVNFHRDVGRIYHGQWGTPMPTLAPWKVELGSKSMGVDIVGWVDGFTAMRRHVVEDIYPLAPIVRKWDVSPELGSGVGAQITGRLAKHEHQVVRPHRSLVRHLPGPSIMNPAVRAKHPLSTCDFIDDP